MSPDAMNALFKPTIDQIVQHLSMYLQATLLSSRAETEALLGCFKPVTGIEVKQLPIHAYEMWARNSALKFTALSKVVRKIVEARGVTLTHVPTSF